MARPKPQVLLNKDMDEVHSWQVLEADKLFVVLYKNKPINLRQELWGMDGVKYKYPKSSFASEAPARNLADKLNRWYKSEDFTYRQVI